MRKFPRLLLLSFSGICFASTLIPWGIGKFFVYINEKTEKLLMWTYYNKGK